MLQKGIALHRAVKAMPKRNVEGSSASRLVRIKGGASDGPSRSLGAAMVLEMGRVDVHDADWQPWGHCEGESG